MNHPLQRYYSLHARIYDVTRWTFLFGRERLLRHVAAVAQPRNILEVGCGTGRNLRQLRKVFPHAKLTGVDLSADMLRVAQRSTSGVTLLQQDYSGPIGGGFDLLLFSYSLSMFNPGWERALRAAKQDVAPGGVLAVVDFSHTGFSFFRKWMGVNHVRMEGHLWPEARVNLETLVDECRPAYAGIWHYGLYIGRAPKG